MLTLILAAPIHCRVSIAGTHFSKPDEGTLILISVGLRTSRTFTAIYVILDAADGLFRDSLFNMLIIYA